METAIKKLLRDNYTDATIHSHVSLVKPRGKFLFNRKVLEEFWNLYCEYIMQMEGKDGKIESAFGIAEKHQQNLPVIVDVDLKMLQDCKRRNDLDDEDIKEDAEDEDIVEGLYTEYQLKTVVGIYQSVLKNILDKPTQEDLICVVLEKPLYLENKNDMVMIKNGFHLHFPYCFLDKIDQETQLIPRVKDCLKEMKLFESIGKENSGDVIDSGCCTVPWLLYGSKKSEDHRHYYQITKIYNASLEEISLKKAFKNYMLYDQHERLIDMTEKGVRFYLPRILSIIPYSRPYVRNIKNGLVSPLKEKIKNDRKASLVDSGSLKNIEKNLEEAKVFLAMLSPERSVDNNDWMAIGWILYNISDGSSDGLDLWCDFSSKCEEKYDESVCIHKWDNMKKGTLGMGTLKHFAGIDNPLEYKKYKNEKSDDHLTNSLEGSHNDIAKALFEEYGDEFRCASVTNKIWYQFKNHRWEQIEDGVFLRQKISGKIIERFSKAMAKLYDKLKTLETTDEQKMIDAKIKQIRKMIQNLKNANYKSAIMKECLEVFYDPRFIEKLDCDPYLIAFSNGVYDLRNNTFRPGRPDDFLSKYMPINYVNYSEDDEKVQEIYTFLEQVFPDKSVKRYFMDIASDVFVGGNHEKIVVFWIGEGDNGKTITQKFFDLMLGKLAIKLNTNVITGKKPSSGSAFPELARAGGGVRWMVLEEPEGDECINNGIIKLLSGGDTYYARDLYEKGKEGREVVPMFKLNVIANKCPRIKNADKAVWNRVRVIPFESVFCRPHDPAPDTYEEQLKQKRFPMDKHFSKKIPLLVEAFAWVLLQHRLKIDTRIEPEKVRMATELYQKQNDIFRQFLDECIIEDKAKNPKLSLSELYGMFKEWFKESLPGNSLPVKNDVEEYFSKYWGKPQAGKVWMGYRPRTLKDDIEKGEAVMIEEEDLADYKLDMQVPM